MSAAEQMVVSGVAVFSHVDTEDSYNGKSTGYSITVQLDDESAAKLQEAGVKLKEYEGTLQKKFTSGYRPQVLDLDGNYVNGEIRRGSKVRVLTALGNEHEQYGVKAYMNKVRLVEAAEADVPAEF